MFKSITLKSYLIRITALLFFFPLFISCDEINDLLGGSSDEDYEKFRSFFREGVISRDGTFALKDNGLFGPIIVNNHFDNFWNDGSYYTCSFSELNGWEGKPEVEIFYGRKHNMNKKIIVKLKKFHSDTEMTVKVSGDINISSLRLKIGELPDVPEAKSYAHNGFTGYYNENIDADGVTADGKSQLRFLLDKNASDIIDITPTFYNRNGEIVSDIKYCGSISTIKINSDIQPNYVIYTAPEYYDDEKNPREICLDVKMGSPGHEFVIPYYIDLNVHKCGVGLIHGLISNAKDCFGDLGDYMCNHFDYESRLIELIDYESTNTSSFDKNQYLCSVVDISLNKMHDRLLSDGIVSSKYDLVGHSMGGILSRLYAQNTNPHAIRKIITLDTPHFGSQLADFGHGLVDYLSIHMSRLGSKGTASSLVLKTFYNTQLTALLDLRTTSKAISELNGDSRLNIIGTTGVHAICSVIQPPQDESTMSYSIRRSEGIFEKVKRFIYEQNKFSNTLIKFRSNVFKKKEDVKVTTGWEVMAELYDEPTHDGVVSLTSQRGGLRDEFVTIETDNYAGVLGLGSNAHHMNTNKWRQTYDNIGKLLDAPVKESGLFSLGGFGQSKSLLSIKNRRALKNDNYYPLENNGDNRAIIIPENSSKGFFRFSVDMGANIASNMIIAQIDNNEEYIWSSAGEYKYELDLDGKTGLLKIIVIGRTDDNGIVIDYKEIEI